MCGLPQSWTRVMLKDRCCLPTTLKAARWAQSMAGAFFVKHRVLPTAVSWCLLLPKRLVLRGPALLAAALCHLLW